MSFARLKHPQALEEVTMQLILPVNFVNSMQVCTHPALN